MSSKRGRGLSAQSAQADAPRGLQSGRVPEGESDINEAHLNGCLGAIMENSRQGVRWPRGSTRRFSPKQETESSPEVGASGLGVGVSPGGGRGKPLAGFSRPLP